MLRWFATLAIAALFVLNGVLPATEMFRRGNEASARSEVAGVEDWIGKPLGEFALTEIDGQVLRLADLRGHRVLLTFERSVDW